MKFPAQDRFFKSPLNSTKYEEVVIAEQRGVEKLLYSQIGHQGV